MTHASPPSLATLTVRPMRSARARRKLSRATTGTGTKERSLVSGMRLPDTMRDDGGSTTAVSVTIGDICAGSPPGSMARPSSSTQHEPCRRCVVSS